MDDDLVDHFFARTTEITDDISFADYYLDSQRRGARANLDDNEVFERAILQGNFSTAQRIFEDGHVDLRKRMVNEWGNESTIFGRLLARSKKYYNTVDKIRFFLSLTRGGDDAFFNVGRVHDMEMTALHVVSLYADYRPDLVSPLPAMNAILEFYYEERHLNACVSGGRSAGCTALHLAISGGNIDSAGRLLNEGAETDVINDQGESAFDLISRITDGESAREKHDRITERLTDLLVRHGAKARKYWGLVRKINPILIELETFGVSAESEDVLLNSASKLSPCDDTSGTLISADEPAPMTDLRRLDDAVPGMAKLCCEMKPDHIAVIGDSRAVEEITAEIASRNEKSASADCNDLVSAQRETGKRRALAPTGSALQGEIIGVTPQGTKIVKTYLDHELPDLCDLLRRF
ncbi:hypothetical protein MMC30_000987 [Trapelia coarctata]|nr:hypothetical protein [Trapelia coarctata]